MMIAVLLISAAPMMTSEADAASGATPDQIAEYALKFKGVPYQWGGTTPSGFDCSGYIRYVYGNFGISLPRTSAEQFGVGTAVSKSNLKKGDLVFFANTYKPGISHTGIYIGNGNVISAESQGISISNINTNPYWAPKYAGAKRLSSVKEAVATVSAPKPAPAPAPAPAPKPDLPKGQYYDVSKTFWAYAPITELSTKNIITGYAHSEFKPNNSVTRAEAAIMIAKSLGIAPVAGTSFKDVSTGHWAASYINAVHKQGIIGGRGDGYYAPDAKITRAEISALLTRAYAMKASNSSVSFTDINGHWAESSILKVASSNLAKGYDDGSFKPNANATRAEFAQFIYNSINQ
ncbi:hydrolase [Planococcus halotolerans]|uniref:Hydrolase n=2 Tax=Planococcus halotolerans TaxID=2233542 RepID=A0A365L867_9BACL|nr:hydrolase [Planococcus halotolerans]RAZ81565.1 hydrolase [Planococcus halotolerans]